MKWTSVLAIYFLIFCLTAFVTLPFGVRTAEEAGWRGFRARPTALPTGSTCPGICCARSHRRAADGAIRRQLSFGWITVDDLDLYN